MLEGGYQSKIIKAVQKDGGVAINGKYTSDGEADLQCGLPIDNVALTPLEDLHMVDEQSVKLTPIKLRKILIHVAVEVKTEADYNRVMRAIDKDYNIIDRTPLKEHESLQLAKIRRNRKLGGLALVAWNYKQIKEYVYAN